MRLQKAQVLRELHEGKGAPGAFYMGDAAKLMPRLLEKYAGQVQLIYIDPPYATGQQFAMRMRVGEKDWKSGVGSLELPAYEDPASQEQYLLMMRATLEGAKALLKETGDIFVHIDFRMHAHVRLLMDEIFGPQNFVNEIVWTYQTGGRARRYFSRKHDIILFYRKSRRYHFNIAAVPIERDGNRRNHMKRHIDTDGRVYRSIRSGGKIYTYYDDEPAYPSDVWDDVSHMQQKDPQRTGYDTQKPLSLLERIVKCASREGDLVMDFFAGAGTTLEAARLLGRAFVGVDMSPVSLHVVRKRLSGANLEIEAPSCEGEPQVAVSLFTGVGFFEITMDKYELEAGLTARAFTGLDALDNWSAGYLRDGCFHCMARDERTRQHEGLKRTLSLPIYEGPLMLRVNDVLGRYFYYVIDLEEDEA